MDDPFWKLIAKIIRLEKENERLLRELQASEEVIFRLEDKLQVLMEAKKNG